MNIMIYPEDDEVESPSGLIPFSGSIIDQKDDNLFISKLEVDNTGLVKITFNKQLIKISNTSAFYDYDEPPFELHI